MSKIFSYNLLFGGESLWEPVESSLSFTNNNLPMTGFYQNSLFTSGNLYFSECQQRRSSSDYAANNLWCYSKDYSSCNGNFGASSSIKAANNKIYQFFGRSNSATTAGQLCQQQITGFSNGSFTTGDVSVIDQSLGYVSYTVGSSTYKSAAVPEFINCFQVGNYYVVVYSAQAKEPGINTNSKEYVKYAYSTNLTSWTVKQLCYTTGKYTPGRIAPKYGNNLLVLYEDPDRVLKCLTLNTNMSVTNSTTPNISSTVGVFGSFGGYGLFTKGNVTYFCSLTPGSNGRSFLFNGTSWESISSQEYSKWLNSQTLYYNGYYIGVNSTKSRIRIYNSDFSKYKDSAIRDVTNILTVYNNELYIQRNHNSGNVIYKANFDKLKGDL